MYLPKLCRHGCMDLTPPSMPHYNLFNFGQIESNGVEVFVAVVCCPKVGKLCEVGDEVHFVLCSIHSPLPSSLQHVLHNIADMHATHSYVSP